MPGANKVEHVCLQVDSLAGATQFYRDVFGLTEVSRQDGTVYLGCGLDENYDLALREGDPGVEHVAVRLNERSELRRYEERLASRSHEFERTDNEEPGQEAGLRLQLPSKLPVELVTVEDKRYRHSDRAAVPGRNELGPLDLNHYNYASPDVQADAEFLQEVLEFKVSEAVGEDWRGGAFLRKGDTHHDIAILDLPGAAEDHASHHHTAFTVRSVDHMVQLIDRVRQAGVSLELGIGRHYAGDNLYAYFQAPDGHRLELTFQMAELDRDTPISIADSPEDAITAWRDDFHMPESFLTGSGLAR